MKFKPAAPCLLVGKLLVLLALLPLATGCFWGDEYETRHLTGHYYLDEFEPGTWYLHFEDEEVGLGDALFNNQVVEAGFNDKCIILRAVGPAPQFYIVPLSSTQDREVARRSIMGPFKLAEFQAAVHRIAGDDVPHIDPALTKAD